MQEKKKREYRTRNFATVVYPESAPANWRETLAETHVPVFISPLHDSDVNPDNTQKKPHYHVLLMFENVKTRDQAIEIFSKIGGVGCESVQTLRGYARYLCHLDNPEKHQYSPENVTALCGADYHAAIGLPTDRYKAIAEMMDFCDDQNITSFAQLCRYARSERPEWFRVLCDSSAVIMGKFLKSKMWENSTAKK